MDILKGRGEAIIVAFIILIGISASSGLPPLINRISYSSIYGYLVPFLSILVVFLLVVVFPLLFLEKISRKFMGIKIRNIETITITVFFTSLLSGYWGNKVRYMVYGVNSIPEFLLSLALLGIIYSMIFFPLLLFQKIMGVLEKKEDEGLPRRK